MSFKLVFRSLQEVFPQVDLRILKAVAIEHSNDVDAAVEFVLYEVLPSLSGPTEASYTLDDTQETKDLPAEVGMQKQDISLGHQGAKKENASLLPGSSVACESDPTTDHTYTPYISYPFMGEVCKDLNIEVDEPNLLLHHEEAEVVSRLPSEPISLECEIADVADHTTDAFHFKSLLFNKTVFETPSSTCAYDHLVSNEESEEEVTSAEHFSQPTQGLYENRCGSLHANVQELYGTEACGNVTVVSSAQNFPSIHEKGLDLQGFGFALEKDMNCLGVYEVPLLRSLARTVNIQDFCDLEVNNSVSGAITSAQDISSSLPEDTPNLMMECGALSDKASYSSLNELEEQHSRGITENGPELATFETDTVSVAAATQSGHVVKIDFLEDFITENGPELVTFETDTVSVADKPTAVATQSGHVVKINFLEDFINDVKSNKKTLVSALESVTNMMTEVEHHEDRAKQAKEEASKAGQDILTKAEDIREMLIHAKEANDMRAGEVYGEKAILATEARELQSRLLNLSDERDKSISVIEEIRQTLEAQLAAAKEEQEAAEQEKLEKEKMAHKILKDQEVIMEDIVQESKRLQLEAEENAKLREFLMDRGSIVDVLQGEIAVICEDVMLLKERVDRRVPPNKLLPSTTCSFASSSSSSSNCRSMLLERTLHPVELGEIPKRTSGELPRSQQLESIANGDREINADDNNKAFSDDDWDFFYPLIS